MVKSEIDILKNALQRERLARKAAEKILEDKSRELYDLSLQLRESNSQLSKLLDDKSLELKGIYDNINDAYLIIDLEGNVLKMNDIAEEIFGYNIKREKFNVNDVLLEDGFESAYEAMAKLIDEGSYSNFETRILTKSKEIKWIQINATAIIEAGVPKAAQGIIRDITSEKHSKELLKESENRLSNLIYNLHTGILLENEFGNVVLTNKKFCEMFELKVNPEELIGFDYETDMKNLYSNFVHPENEFKRFEILAKNKLPVSGDEVFLTNGTILERDFIPLFSEGQFKGNLWSYRDITLNRRYRVSLEKEKAKYSNIIANMNLGLVEVNNDDEIIFANQSFCDMSGYSLDELIGRRGKDIFLEEEERKIINYQNERRLQGKSDSYELIVKDKKGKTKTWLISGAPNYNLKGEIIGSIGIHLDITEFKLLQKQKEIILDQLEQSNKELHEYAHIVSHDLKSPLRSIDALINWIKEDNLEKFDEQSLENFELIENTLETMEMLISDVLRYSKVGSQKERNKLLNLNDILNRLIESIYIPEHITIKIKDKLPIVKGNKTEFQQLFQNLISNAVKFIDKENGKVEIGFKEFDTFYEFFVADNGIGIDKKYHQKIFQIFHSLKKSSESTGIGLSIVKKIVDTYNGKIWLESEVGKGTTFFFTLQK